ASFNSVTLDIGQSNVFAKGDRLALGIGMPIAVTSGRATITLPVASGRSASSVSFAPVAIDLSPEQRQKDLSLTYQREIGDGAELIFSLIHAENYGNQAGVTDNAGIIAFSYAF
ncbi:MAG: hypothetical protein WBA91_03265, partial [Paracoccaceae bacterium]